MSVGQALTGSLRTAPVYIALDSDDVTVRAGMFARASISLPATDAIVLPAEAVLIEDGVKTIVYVKKAEGQYVARSVEVGPSIGGKVQILSGLVAGDEVVTTGALLLDGAAEQLL
jgi:cobalt-zinc-cadmium efflux system membrane fusion protein